MRDKISALLADKLQATPPRKDSIINDTIEVSTPQMQDSPKPK